MANSPHLTDATIIPFPRIASQLSNAAAMSIAWDEAAECLTRRDVAGFDAAMRIFRALDPNEQQRDGSGNATGGNPLPSNS